MTLGEATSRFLDGVGHNDSDVSGHLLLAIRSQSLALLAGFFPPDTPLSQITPSRLRDFLSRWYVEKASGSNPIDSQSIAQDNDLTAGRLPHPQYAQPTDKIPEPLDLLDSLAELFKWADDETGVNQATGFSPVLIELRHSLPRALAITKALSNALRGLGGAFNFPEFLTSFEEGGSSQYDIDVPGNVGAIDGYFRIVRVEGLCVEAEELISEERVWPIVFPEGIAPLLDDGYIINLELVRKPEGWQIAGCGFAYPPGTEVG